MSKLIGLTGFARSGKDTVANYLCNEYGFTKDSFAAPIRQFVAHILGLSLEELERYKEAPLAHFKKTPRQMMQTVGTEWGRQMIQDDLWIQSLLVRIAACNIDFVISDVRFDNEAVILRDMGAQIWHIEKPSQDSIHSHISEAGIYFHPSDKRILNIGTFISLYEAVDKLMENTNE